MSKDRLTAMSIEDMQMIIRNMNKRYQEMGIEIARIEGGLYRMMKREHKKVY